VISPMRGRIFESRAGRRCTTFAIAFGIRLAALLITGPNLVSFGDGADYLATARYVCVEQRYPDRGNLPFFRAPLLPFFIAASTGCHTERVPLVKVALALCDAGTAVVLGEIASLLFSSYAAAWVASILAAFDPFFVLGAVDVQTEPLFMFLLTVAIWAFFRATKDGGTRAALFSGFAFALAALARPSGLVALAFACLTLPFSYGLRRPRWRLGIVVAAGASIALLPWVTRNAVRYHELIVVNDAGGFSFWRGSHPEMDRISGIADRAEYRRAALAFETGLTSAAARGIEMTGRSPMERSRAWTEAALQNMKRHPAEAVSFAFRKAWRYWRPWLNPQEHGRAAVVASAIVNTLLFAFGALGLAQFWRRDRTITLWVVGYFLLVWFAHIPHQVVMRFRIPFTDPLLLVFSALAIVALWKPNPAARIR
jgi:4-amino-4-deoxy-L-arabinose transferase-like glycosyltransferase